MPFYKCHFYFYLIATIVCIVIGTICYNSSDETSEESTQTSTYETPSNQQIDDYAQLVYSTMRSVYTSIGGYNNWKNMSLNASVAVNDTMSDKIKHMPKIAKVTIIEFVHSND